MDAFTASDSREARELLRKAAKTYKVIFLTDIFCKDLEDLLHRMLEQAYPVVVPIPSDAGSNGYPVEVMKEQMERALGVDVLFNREDK